MISLKVVNKDEYSNYELEDNNGKKYELNINFIDVDKMSIGNILYIDEDVIKENVSLNFGIVGQDKLINGDKDLIAIIDNNNKIFLQRYYG